MAIFAAFANGQLSIGSDDNLNHNITVSRNAAGTILINGGAVVVQGGTPTVANTAVIALTTQDGKDTITLDEANGALPQLSGFTNGDDDVITGGSGLDTLGGGGGNDIILGKGGNDFLFGGEGNDTLTGGDANDQMFGEGGNDRMIWNPGDDSDLMEGGEGTDTAEVNGGNGAESFTITANAGRVKVERVNPAPFTLDIGTTENLVINANGGDDQIIASGDLSPLIKLTLNGGTGADTLVGANGDDTLVGGDDGDLLIGKGGNDTALMGDGNDTFQWDAGDGNDTVEGQGDFDTLVFNGNDVAEIITVTGNNGRVSLHRDIDNATLDVAGVERIDINAAGGADTITVGNLAGTQVTEVNVNLQVNGAGDTQGDRVTVQGTGGDDLIDIVGAGSSVSVIGLAAQVNVTGVEGIGDMLVVEGGAGNDTIRAGTLAADVVGLQIDGGAGNDTITGSQGLDLIMGGDGNDTISGGRDGDIALMDEGDDTFIWNPGDGSDIVKGGGGTDTLQFNGANIGEKIDIFVDDETVHFTRDIASVEMQLDEIETINFRALGGADTITINDLSASDVKTVNIDLTGPNGGGDGANDTIVINGTSGNDTIVLKVVDGKLVVEGLATKVVIENFETTDTIKINGLSGDDVIDASALGLNGPKLVFDGGQGDDILTGGAGDDTLIGNDGDDVLIGNIGNDALDGGTGSNLVFQSLAATVEDGVLTLFGTNAADAITVSRNLAGEIFANGQALPGSPTVGTIDLIQVLGKDGNDTLTLDETNGTLPRAEMFGGAGDDTIIGGSRADQLFGEAGNDTLFGKLGSDVLFGGAGDDTLVGGQGDDQMFGEAGNDRLVWNVGDGTDLFEGGDGTDTAEVNGANGDEEFTVTANGTRVRFDRLNQVPFSLDLGTTEKLVVNMNGGNDKFSATGNLAALIGVTVDGGAGNDTILGSNGADTLIGGADNDFIDGQQGNDTILMGDGDDTFQWDPGDGSDTVDGGAGFDTMLFNGSAGNEIFELVADGDHARFTRNLGGIVMDLDNLERVALRALGGTDAVTVGDMSGTDVKQVDIDLAAQIGGQASDQLLDTVVVSGSDGNNQIKLTDTIDAVAGGSVKITGLPGEVTIAHADATDTLTVKGLGGNDTIDASAVTGAMKLTLEGGAGNDTIVASVKADVIDGGEGNDTVSYAGSASAVTINLGAGDAHGGNAEGDIITNVENVTGSAHDDFLSGSTGANVIDGGAGNDSLKGGGGADTLIGGAGNDEISGGEGDDTAVFNVDFNTVKVSFDGANIVIESAEGRDVVNGVEHLKFTDGTIDLKDENPLVNDLFYLSQYKDVWDLGIDPDVHYATVGFREGRDPNPEFSTNGYLSANADVRAAGINPLEHFATIGWKEGRDPGPNFDIEQYLAANPDVAISGVDPLSHYEAFGREEGRAIFGAVGKPLANGFDAEFYLLNNPDVGFAGVDPLQHYQIFGHNELRDPNAYFDAKGYLAAYSDVAAAGVDPFQHYLLFGAAEGRDPSGAFDTKGYLDANPDVAAAGVNPLLHFLTFGVHEGRSPHGDGLFA